jgi:hypothetical protein
MSRTRLRFTSEQKALIVHLVRANMRYTTDKDSRDDRDRKLEQALHSRQLARQQTPGASPANASLITEVA